MHNVDEPRCPVVTNAFAEFMKTYWLHPCPAEVVWMFLCNDMKAGRLLFEHTLYVILTLKSLVNLAVKEKFEKIKKNNMDTFSIKC